MKTLEAEADDEFEDLREPLDSVSLEIDVGGFVLVVEEEASSSASRLIGVAVPEFVSLTVARELIHPCTWPWSTFSSFSSLGFFNIPTNPFPSPTPTPLSLSLLPLPLLFLNPNPPKPIPSPSPSESVLLLLLLLLILGLEGARVIRGMGRERDLRRLDVADGGEGVKEGSSAKGEGRELERELRAERDYTITFENRELALG